MVISPIPYLCTLCIVARLLFGQGGARVLELMYRVCCLFSLRVLKALVINAFSGTEEKKGGGGMLGPFSRWG